MGVSKMDGDVRRLCRRRRGWCHGRREHDMAKYLYAYHGGGGMAESEAAQAEIMAAWGAWFGQLGPAIVDGGAPSGAASTIAADGSVVDGAGSNPVTGYSIISADSRDEALALAKGCPVLTSGGSVEVVELLEV